MGVGMSDKESKQEMLCNSIYIKLVDARDNLEDILNEDYDDLTYSLTTELNRQLKLLNELIKFLKDYTGGL